MGPIRRILGHVSVETAKKKRHCSRNKNEHIITMGQVCLVIAEPSYQGSKNYCCTCAKEILKRASQDLSGLEIALLG